MCFTDKEYKIFIVLTVSKNSGAVNPHVHVSCKAGKESPEERVTFTASSLRKKFALAKASSLEMEDKKVVVPFSPSPKSSPVSSAMLSLTSTVGNQFLGE